MAKRCLLSIAAILFMFFSTLVAVAQTDIQTPKESEVAKHFRQGLTVFLCFHDAKEPNLNKIKSDIAAVTVNFKGAVETVYVSGDDKKEDSLRGKYKIQPDKTAVFVVQPSGIVVTKLTGADITKTNLMKAVVSSNGGGKCGPGCSSCR